MNNKDKCKYCGGDKAIRNPTGNCDHLYYPDNVNKFLAHKDKVRELIGELVGSASMCWKPYPKGVFWSDKASELVDKALKEIDSHYHKKYENFVAEIIHQHQLSTMKGEVR